MTTFFIAGRRGPKFTGNVSVRVESEPNPEMNPDGTHDLFGEVIEEATLPRPEAVEWLVTRGCMRHEAERIVGQVDSCFMGTSTGAVPTTAEWELDQPVTRPEAD